MLVGPCGYNDKPERSQVVIPLVPIKCVCFRLGIYTAFNDPECFKVFETATSHVWLWLVCCCCCWVEK